MSDQNVAPQQAEEVPTNELSLDDVEGVAGGHRDETTSIWHDIGTGITEFVEWCKS